MRDRFVVLFVCLGVWSLGLEGQSRHGLGSQDLFRLQSVRDVEVSPDGARVAYSVVHNDEPGRPYAIVHVLNLATGATHALPRGSSEPRWAPDGRRLAFLGQGPDGGGLMVSEADGSGARLVAPVRSTNHPLPSAGQSVAWAPDGRRIALVSATPGPEDAEANGDPMVITPLPLQAHRGRGPDALQRQPAHPRLRRRHRHASADAAHRRHVLRALDRLGAERRRGPVCLESRSRSRQVVQLRRVRGVAAHAPVTSPDPRRRAPSTRPCGRPTARASRFRAPRATSRRRKRRWRTRTCG